MIKHTPKTEREKIMFPMTSETLLIRAFSDTQAMAMIISFLQ